MANLTQQDIDNILLSNHLLYENNQYNIENINQILLYIKRYFVTKTKLISNKHKITELRRVFRKLSSNMFLSSEDVIIAMLHCGFIKEAGKDFFNISEKDYQTAYKKANPDFYYV